MYNITELLECKAPTINIHSYRASSILERLHILNCIDLVKQLKNIDVIIMKFSLACIQRREI